MITSKTSLTYQTLKRELLNGVYAPGAKMRIDQLSESLGVSPGAVRESLSRLTSDGLVVAADQRGFVVAPISAADLIDLTEVRISIEVKCLQRSIQIGDLSWESGIAAAWHQLAHTPAIDPKSPNVMNADWTDAHTVFHDSLIAASDSVWWLKLREQLYIQAERYRRLLLPHSKVSRDVDAEHAALVKATLARDADTASELLRAHLQHTVDVLIASDAPFSDMPRANDPKTKS